MSPAVRLDAAGLTDKGCVRANNEDAFLCDPASGVFLVSDGMGGLEAGEAASALAVESVAGRLRALPGGGPGEQECRLLVRELEQAFEEANVRVRGLAGRLAAPGGAGATLVGLARCAGGFVLANAGDSRAYRVRGGGIEQLTEDHSLVMARVRLGLMSAEEARVSPERSVIYRALGMEARLEADVTVVDARPGDLYLLCTDGLSNTLDDPELLDLAREDAGGSLEERCARMVALALERGARDNVTAVLVRCLEA